MATSPAIKAILSPNDVSNSGQLEISNSGIFGYSCPDTTVNDKNDPEREGRSGGLCLLWSNSIHITSHDSTCWRFTDLYGNPDTSLRTQFWTLLKRLGDASSMPWLCGGDLNEILFGHEKQGGAARAQYLMNAFREATNYCGLANLGFRGPKFTWNRGKNACLVQERLDRMLGNGGWLDLFPNSLVHHLNLRGSDHCPLLVELLWVDESSSIGKIWKRGHFHFEEAWVDEVECNNLNKNHWHSSAAASARKSKNSITGLIYQNGKWCEEEEGLAHIIESYFKSVFTSSSPSATNFDRVLHTIEAKITLQLNGQLEQAFEAEDVRKSSLPNGTYKEPWSRWDVCNLLPEILADHWGGNHSSLFGFC
ncbi:hypothetical protein UlMin_037496 [Ulmus minor]